MNKKGKAYKKLIRSLAMVYVFFVTLKRKPRYLYGFLAMFLAVVLVIAIPIVAISLNHKDPADKLKNDFTQEREDSGKDVDKDASDRWTRAVWAMEQDASDALWYGDIHVDISGLKGVNRDIIGWIYFEAADISYPVLYSGDNSLYLRASYEGKYEVAGSIFLEGQDSRDFSDKHMLIYGHNMRDDTMFGQLSLYKDEKDYYKNHQYFQLIYMDEETEEIVKERYHIFACKVVTPTDNIYEILDKDSDKLEEFTSEVIRNNNYLDTNTIEVTDSDKVITLSTCADNTDYRFVVSALKCAQCVVK